MDESQSQPVSEHAGPSATTLTTRLTNVFVSPSEVFDEVKISPPTPTNWIAPLVATMVMGIIYVMVIFSQPAILQEIKEAKEKRLQILAASGKVPQAELDKARQVADILTSPTFLKTFGIMGAFVANTFALFFTGLVIWLLGRYVFHAFFGYMKAVEVTGLSLMISVLGAIINMLLIVIYGNTSITAGPALFLSHYDRTNALHLSLTAINVPSLWCMAVLSLGMAKLCGTSFWKAAGWLFGLWATITFGSILLIKAK